MPRIYRTAWKGRYIISKRVREGYLYIARQEPHRVRILDARQPLDAVVNGARQEIERLLISRGWK